ncbi:unnamed protein product [Peniophora sp. CBMAI 1063]|nr:unnamed protein product [Peniophora sp. CBMAI 1063]
MEGRTLEEDHPKLSSTFAPFEWFLSTRVGSYAHLWVGSRRAAKMGWHGTKILLDVLKESSDAFPPLKSAVGGLLALIAVYERTKSNDSDLQNILHRIDRLLGILGDRLRGDRHVVHGFADESFAKMLIMYLAKLEEMTRRGSLVRVAHSIQIGNELRDVCTAIERAIQELQLRIGLSLESLTRAVLKEAVLQNLPRAKDAAYSAAVAIDGVRRRHCTPGTRNDILEQIMTWALDEDEHTAPVYWISGLAGQGKTTIGYTICERLEKLRESKEVAFVSLFCSRQLDTHDERFLVSTLAHGLADCSASYASELVEALKAERTLGDQSLSIQMSKLFIRPWRRSERIREGLRPFIVVIDALDENEAGAEFIELILSASRAGELKGLRILLTSRPEPSIRHLCESIDGRAVCNLNEVTYAVVDGDILNFLYTELPEHRNQPYLRALGRVSGGLFIYASTAVRLVNGKLRTIKEQRLKIQQIIDHTSTQSSEGILDGLYAEIIEDAFETFDAIERGARERILLVVVCTSMSLPLSLVGILANAERPLVRKVVEALYSVLYIDVSGNVRWHHASFQDYVLATYESSMPSIRLHIIRRCRDILLTTSTTPFTETDLGELISMILPDDVSISDALATQRLVDLLTNMVLRPESRQQELKRQLKEKRKAEAMAKTLLLRGSLESTRSSYHSRFNSDEKGTDMGQEQHGVEEPVGLLSVMEPLKPRWHNLESIPSTSASTSSGPFLSPGVGVTKAEEQAMDANQAEDHIRQFAGLTRADFVAIQKRLIEHENAREMRRNRRDSWRRRRRSLSASRSAAPQLAEAVSEPMRMRAEGGLRDADQGSQPTPVRRTKMR